MRGGSENYLIKDMAFYRSKMTAALGVDTERIYEEIRAYTWRSRTKGMKKLRKEIKSGRLSACIRMQNVADSLGLSLSTVKRRVDWLRRIGWLRVTSGKTAGEASLYELGYILQGGVELFYADIDCRDFCIHLSEVAEEREEEVYQLTIQERVELAKTWFTQQDRAVLEGSSHRPTPREGSSHRATPYPREDHPTQGGRSVRPTRIDNPPGARIDKSEEYIRGSDDPDTHASGRNQDGSADSLSSSKKKIQTSNDQLEIQNSNTIIDQEQKIEEEQEIDQEQKIEEEQEIDQEQKIEEDFSFSKNNYELENRSRRLDSGREQKNKEDFKSEEGVVTTFAIDNALDAGSTAGYGDGHDDGDTRLSRAAQAASAAESKADDQLVANATRRIQKQRTAKLHKVTSKESKLQNLNGRQYPLDVVKAARCAWDVYKDEIETWDEAFKVPSWGAKGNTKLRGQVLELVQMYGGEETEQAIRYVVRYWDVIGSRIFKGSPGGVPNLGRLFALHEQLFREATVWGRHREVLEEWEAWFRDNPMKVAPDELKERYEGARSALSSLGLG